MSMMRSNLVSVTSEFSMLQVRSNSLGMSSGGGLLSHKSQSNAFGNPAGGRLPGQLVKLQLSRVPLPLAITNHVRSSRSTVTWYDMGRPMNLGIVFITQFKACVIERHGKYLKTLYPGGHFLIPFVDKIAYVHSLSREAVEIPPFSVTTKDGFVISSIHGNVRVKIFDPVLASYGEGHPVDYLLSLAHETISSEVGKMTAEEILDDRATLEKKIQTLLDENEGIKNWGLQCYNLRIMGLGPLALEVYGFNNRVHLGPKGDAEAIIAGAHSIAEDITMVSKNLKDIVEDIAIVSKNLKDIVEDIAMVSKTLKAQGAVECYMRGERRRKGLKT